MAATAPPFPPLLWAKLRAFLASGATGQAILHVHDGVVTKMELVEVVRAPKSREGRPALDRT